MFIGLAINICLLGIMTMQTYLYYTKYSLYAQRFAVALSFSYLRSDDQRQEMDQSLRASGDPNVAQVTELLKYT